jgi:hypothetical protein
MRGWERQLPALPKRIKIVASAILFAWRILLLQSILHALSGFILSSYKGRSGGK